MKGVWDFLKSLAKEASVRALLIGLVVNLLLALWANVAPSLPAWFPSPAPIIQALGVWLELLIVGWAASRIKDRAKSWLLFG